MSSWTTTYTAVVWTSGDVATESKMDSMTANDIAYDSHEAEGLQIDDIRSAADHITVTPGASKLVKIAVLRQNNTTDAYTNDQVILTGYGIIAGAASELLVETVTFGITFSDVPIIQTTFTGYHSTGTTYGAATDDYGETNYITASVRAATTTTFEVQLFKSTNANFTTGNYFYTWTAIGTL